ncbi:MAG: hypothetical protein PF450_07920 [Bacteroidales bacterium]|jgi:hypothetical protein|nr:hypothetical protein [Bacteroidales bacterium]
MKPIISIVTILLLSALAVNAQTVFKVDYSSQADVKVYVVKYESQCDLKVYIVDYESQAGWKNEKKSHLFKGN